MLELDFLKTLVLSIFADNKGIVVPKETVCIVSIQPSQGFTHGYEIRSRLENNQILFHLYFNISDTLYGQFFDINNLQQTVPGTMSLVDEVFVINCELPKILVDNLGYKFLWTDGDCSLNRDLLLLENGGKILLESGGFVLQE